MMHRLISIVTIIAWLYVLLACITALYMGPNYIAGPNHLSELLLGIALILTVCCVIGAAVYSLFRSVHALSVLMFVASLFPAYVFARAMFQIQDPSGARFFELLWRGDYGWVRLTQDITFLGLPFCWAVICLQELTSGNGEQNRH